MILDGLREMNENYLNEKKLTKIQKIKKYKREVESKSTHFTITKHQQIQNFKKNLEYGESNSDIINNSMETELNSKVDKQELQI